MKNVSVVIPTYNHSKFVGEAIESALSSNGVCTEIIVVNDGSTDDTHQMLFKYPGIRYFLTENKGAHAALNFGIAQSKNEYISILNDDDVYHNNHLLSSVLELESTGVDIVIARYLPFGEGPLLEQIEKHEQISMERIEFYGLLKTLFQVNWAVSTSSFCFRKKLFQSVEGFSQLSMCHDYEFLLSALFDTSGNLLLSNRVGWNYRCHSANSSKSIDALDRSAQWLAATLFRFNHYPVHIQEYLRKISLEHFGLKDEVFSKILGRISDLSRYDMKLSSKIIRDLLSVQT
jgi:glycosyltransferase involved in cell wall biosynthesis